MCNISGLRQAVSKGKDTSVDFYNSWNKEVISSVPEERLLVIEEKQMGWDALCRFLGVSSPPEDFKFPNCNTVNGTNQLLSLDINSLLGSKDVTLRHNGADRNVDDDPNIPTSPNSYLSENKEKQEFPSMNGVDVNNETTC